MLVAIAILMHPAAPGAVDGGRQSAGVSPGAQRVAFAAGNVSTTREAVAPRLSTSLLRVQNVTLVSPHDRKARPATILRFDLVNSGSTSLTDFVLTVSVARRAASLTATEVVLRPWTIRGRTVLHEGYTMTYEMVLPSVPSECDCVATVDVVSARWLVDSGRVIRPAASSTP